MDDRSNRWIVLILLLALLYIISPVDFIPDPIPVVGLVDDMLVGLGTKDGWGSVRAGSIEAERKGWA
jgi:Protein of unknown function (DUF1232)